VSELILPTLDEVNRPYWESCREGVLRLQRCGACDLLRYPIAAICPTCLSTELEWEKVSGRGEVFSFIVFRHAYNAAWKDRIPYTVAIVQLPEGPRVLATIVETAPEDVHVGLPVEVIFERVSGEVMIPNFRALSA